MKIIKYGIFSTAISLIFSACGAQKPHVETQHSDNIKPPTFPAKKSSFSLTSNDSREKTKFEGPILLWRNNVEKNEMAEVLRMKKTVSAADIMYKKHAFSLDYLSLSAAKVQKQISDNNKVINHKLNLMAFYKDQNVELNENALVWKNQNIISEKNKDKFALFCQAHIWKMASSDLLKDYNFSKRPSPLGVCEPYYIENNYFNSEECKPASKDSGRRYLACFWGESGVSKTSVKMFDYDTFDELNAVKRDEVYSELETNAWQKSTKLNTSIVKDNMLTIQSGKSFILDFKDIFTLELSKILVDYSFLESSQNEQKNHLKALVLSRQSQNKSASMQINYNFNDILLNLPFISKADQDSLEFAMKETDFDLLMKKGVENDTLFGQSISEADLNKISSLKEANLSLKKEEASFKHILQSYAGNLEIGQIGYEKNIAYTSWMNSRGELAKYIIDRDMAASLWPYASMTAQQSGEITVLRLKLDNKEKDTTEAIACFNTKTGEQCVVSGVKKYVPLWIKKDFETGILHGELSNIKDETFFLPPMKNSPYFQDESLTQETLMKKTIKFELSPGVLNHELPVLSGKIFVYSDEDKILEGNISLTMSSLNEDG